MSDSRTYSSSLRILLVAGLTLGSMLSGTAQADVYRWVDDQGGIHFSDTSAAGRARVEPAEARRDNWNRLRQDSSRTRVLVTRRHEIALEQSSFELRVRATLNERLETSFVLDTGATVSVIPRATVEALGIRLDESTPTIEVRGVLARARRVPIVTLQEVRVGSAVVRDVRFAVVDDAPEGLLGMPFLNHFRMQTDPLAGTLTLDEIEPEALARTAAAGSNGVVHRRAFMPALTWGAVPGATRYHVEIARDEGFARLVEDTWAEGAQLDLASLDAKLEEGAPYFWRVAAQGTYGSAGAWSEVASFQLP